MKHRGILIIPCAGGFSWEEPVYGSESEEVFSTLDQVKADIERWFGPEPGPRVVDGEIVYAYEMGG